MARTLANKGTKIPKVSVLMNCYNSAEFLREAIDSVYAQSFQDFEIIFVDNCSVDNSAEIAMSYDERLLYTKTPVNIPLYSARKFGLQYVSGEFLAVLDCDDYWRPFKLEYQLKKMEEKKLNFIYGAFDIFFMTTSMRQAIYFKLYRIFHLFKMFCQRSRFTTVEEQILKYNINLQTVLVRRSAMKDLTFSPKINLLGDYDFFLRFGLMNDKKYYYDNRIVSTTRIHPGQLSYKSLRNWYKECRYLYFFTYKPLLNHSEKVNFKKVIKFFNSSYLWEKKEYKESLKIKREFRNESVMFFIHWLKYKTVSLLK